jgi:hypothetical protein
MTLTEDDLKQVRAEIGKAFRSMAVDAGLYEGGADELTTTAADVVKDVAETVARWMTPAEPEPVNPFAPKRTADQWAVILRSTIDAAEKDGHDVWINNDCCGCSRMTLEVGSETEHVRVIGDSG